MTNPTQPTPEQLQAWRELFEDGLHRFAKKRSGCGLYVDHTIHEQWRGYLRAKQENEQALKDAVKDTVKTMVSAFIQTIDDNKVPMSQEVRAQLMELLK